MAARLTLTFLEGVVTFVSPCLLPMLPVYAAYFAGGAGGATDAGRSPAHTARCAGGFVLGFSAVFCALGALAGGLGGALGRWSVVMNVACGAVVLLLGLNYLGVLRVPALRRMLRPRSDVLPRGFLSSLAFGVVFAVGWTPCVGTFLAAALAEAAAAGGTPAGVALLLAYSLGLGLPFFLAALFIDRLGAALSWARTHARAIDVACGLLLVVAGLLMASGTFGLWLRALSV